MNLFSFFHPHPKRQEAIATEHHLVALDGLDYNITEGGEFIDDAIRMKEQPLVYTEESVAAGSPDAFF